MYCVQFVLQLLFISAAINLVYYVIEYYINFGNFNAYIIAVKRGKEMFSSLRMTHFQQLNFFCISSRTLNNIWMSEKSYENLIKKCTGFFFGRNCITVAMTTCEVLFLHEFKLRKLNQSKCLMLRCSEKVFSILLIYSSKNTIFFWRVLWKLKGNDRYCI